MDAVNYTFYVEAFHGKLTEDDFCRLSVPAAAYLDAVTHGRTGEPMEEAAAQKARLALCGLCDALLLNEQGGGVVSESNDGISVTYAASKTAQSDEQRLWSTVCLYLSGTGLLYRGVR